MRSGRLGAQHQTFVAFPTRIQFLGMIGSTVDSYSYHNTGVDPFLCGIHRTEPHCSPSDNCDSTCGNEWLAQYPELRCREIDCLDYQLSVVAFHHKKNTLSGWGLEGLQVAVWLDHIPLQLALLSILHLCRRLQHLRSAHSPLAFWLTQVISLSCLGYKR